MLIKCGEQCEQRISGDVIGQKSAFSLDETNHTLVPKLKMRILKDFDNPHLRLQNGLLQPMKRKVQDAAGSFDQSQDKKMSLNSELLRGRNRK